jgi:hypothetical protein
MHSLHSQAATGIGHGQGRELAHGLTKINAGLGPAWVKASIGEQAMKFTRQEPQL